MGAEMKGVGNTPTSYNPLYEQPESKEFGSSVVKDIGKLQKQESHDAKPLGLSHRIRHLASEARDAVSGFKDSALESVTRNAKALGSSIKDQATNAKEKASSVGNAILGKVKGDKSASDEFTLTQEGTDKPVLITETHSQILNKFNAAMKSYGNARDDPGIKERIKSLTDLSEAVANNNGDIEKLREGMDSLVDDMKKISDDIKQAKAASSSADKKVEEEELPLPPRPNRAPPPPTPRQKP